MPNSTIDVAFIWHMHQPDYRDSTGVMKMPWVFLHAIKDYYEMPWLLTHFEGIKATFNITAPLIEQLNLYDDPAKNDYFFSLWTQHPGALNEDNRAWMVKLCKSTQFETMVKPLAPYAKLYVQENYDDDALIDIQMWFILSWCSNYLRMHNATIKRFLGYKTFSQEDKAVLLEALVAHIKTILPFYKKLLEDEKISITITPYYHPIIPLLLDAENAKKANPHTTVAPHSVAFKEDAITQIKMAIKLYETTFGHKPNGMWPAEGAVDEASAKLYKDNGIQFIATDEAILFKSLNTHERTHLYAPYDFDGITVGFRDHGLSDLIGFTYRYQSAHEAVNDFFKHLNSISLEQSDATVFVILDGENAWEFYENNAYEFFTTLYQSFHATQAVRTITIDEVLGKTAKPLKRLASGSWIHGTFDTWMGHKAKNRAWSLIYEAKRDVLANKAHINEEAQKRIDAHFLQAQCSDWFWWYGDDHATQFAYEFDSLFRNHIIDIYHTMNVAVPEDLFHPIVENRSGEDFWVQPKSEISVHIDGKKSHFFEWLGCGTVYESKLFSTMDKVRGPIEIIEYGYDNKEIYFAFIGDIPTLINTKSVLCIKLQESDFDVRIPLNETVPIEGVTYAIDARIEVGIKRSAMKLEDDTLYFRFEIIEDENVVQTLPGFGALRVVLDATHDTHWFV